MPMPDGTKALSLAGKSYGSWLVVRQEERPQGKLQQGTFWLCQCKCGYERVYSGGNISANRLNRNGCERCRSHCATKGGETPTYATWRGMMERCNNPNHVNYRHYGGRGISVCPRWSSFANFLEDMGERPAGMTLDREHGDRGYDPGNCRWATYSVQAQNSSNAKLNDAAIRLIRARLDNGEARLPIAEEYGITVKTVSRIRHRQAWKNV